MDFIRIHRFVSADGFQAVGELCCQHEKSYDNQVLLKIVLTKTKSIEAHYFV